MDNDILADFPQEHDMEIPDAKTEEKVTETPADSPTENKPEGEPATPQAGNTEDDNKLPFHNNPRWKKMYESNKSMKAELEEMRAFREEMQSRVQEPAPVTNQPAWHKRIHGDDPVAWAEYQSYEKEQRAALKAELEQEQMQKQQQSVVQQERYQSMNDEALSQLEEEQTFDRNKLLKFVLDFNEKYHNVPQKADGSIDFAAALELMNKLEGDDNADKSQARKKLASQTTSTNRGSGTPGSRPLSLQEVRNKSWDELARG